LVSQILNEEKKKAPIIKLIMVIGTLVFVSSSAAYVVTLISISYLLIKYMKKHIAKIVKMIPIILFGLITLFTYYWNKIVSSNIIYLMFSKVSDTDNLSTIQRSITVFTNFKIFSDYPISGVGMGNQGFLYAEYFPKWGYKSIEYQPYLTGERWPGEGGFLPSYVAGYGLVGIVILVVIMVMVVRSIKQFPSTMQYTKDYCIIGIVNFFVLSVYTTNIFGNYVIAFLLAFSLSGLFINKINIDSKAGLGLGIRDND
jgi:hypothetical protein